VGLDGYDWEYFNNLRIDIEYDVQGSIIHWENHVDENGVGYDAMKFQIELRDGNTLAARITNSWRFRRGGYKQALVAKNADEATAQPLATFPEFHVDGVSAERMKTMAAILRDPYRVHWDREATTEMGLKGRVINQGPLNLSYIVNSIHSFAGPGSVRRLTVAFHRPVFDDDVLVAGGEVLSTTDGVSTCNVWLKRGDELMVTGTAMVGSAA
jgi:acyl dehydratase